MKHDSWTATDTIMGENQLVVKTTGLGCEESKVHFSFAICWSGDGLLTLRLKETGGFKWEHIGSYRLDAQHFHAVIQNHRCINQGWVERARTANFAYP